MLGDGACSNSSKESPNTDEGNKDGNVREAHGNTNLPHIIYDCHSGPHTAEKREEQQPEVEFLYRLKYCMVLPYARLADNLLLNAFALRPSL